MIRTDIYLTNRQRNILKVRSKLKGFSMAHLVRTAIDLYIEQIGKEENDNGYNLESTQAASQEKG